MENLSWLHHPCTTCSIWHTPYCRASTQQMLMNGQIVLS